MGLLLTVSVTGTPPSAACTSAETIIPWAILAAAKDPAHIVQRDMRALIAKCVDHL